MYLSIRAFQLSRLGRDADSQRDIAEMGRVLPSDWQVVMSLAMPSLAGGGDRARHEHIDPQVAAIVDP